jgi:hypothetical protein
MVMLFYIILCCYDLKFMSSFFSLEVSKRTPAKISSCYVMLDVSRRTPAMVSGSLAVVCMVIQRVDSRVIQRVVGSFRLAQSHARLFAELSRQISRLLLCYAILCYVLGKSGCFHMVVSRVMQRVGAPAMLTRAST